MADSNFDDEAVDMAPKPARRRMAAAADDEEGEPNANEAPPTQSSRPPMKGWGDSPAAQPPQNVSKAVVVESSSVSEGMNDEPAAATPVGDAGSKAPFGRRAQAQRAGAPKDKFDTDTITVITEIPDLEEEPREADLTSAVAEAPNVRSTRIQALQDLDQQILFQLPSAMGDGIDLSLLTSALSPQLNVAEPDQLWEFDQMFADVSSEMLAEMEPPEKEEGEEGEEPDDENAGVARGDGKKAAQPIRDRANKGPAAAASQ